MESELERVEGGFGITPRDHFKGLRDLLPKLKGLAILDNDGQGRQSKVEGQLTLSYWKRYEAENYFVTPGVLRRYAQTHYADMELFDGFQAEIEEVLDDLVYEQVFDAIKADFDAWKQSPSEAARLVWEAKTERMKLSSFAEEFFRRLSKRLSGPMLLKKGELHRLAATIDSKTIPAEVTEKLNLLAELFRAANPPEAVNGFENN